jgi:hypothetical protein
MLKELRSFFIFSLFLTKSIISKEMTIDLNKPNYQEGIFSTNDGGVIQGKHFRLQAKNIKYINSVENDQIIRKIHAKGALLLQLKCNTFVADEIEFDLITNQGTLKNAKTYISPWYIGGEYITLDKKGDFFIKNAFITTCVEKNSSWDLAAKSIEIYNNELLYAKNIQFRMFKVPTFWLPFYKINLKKFNEDPLIKYGMTWDKKVGPRATIRYQIYSWKDLAFFIRADFRLKKNYGGAIEMHYLPEHRRQKLISKNYLARDILPNDPRDIRRYRYQGEACSKSLTGKTNATITWDKYSDILMPNDFKSDDFEINPSKKTELFIRHKENDMIAILHSRLKVNNFESVKQDLPTAFINFKTYKFPKIELFSQNFTKISYLDYSYSDDLETNLQDFASFRFESNHEVYRPFNLSALKVTPFLGAVGIYYNKSQLNRSVGLGILKYGTDISSHFSRNFTFIKHAIEPYFFYHGLSRPTININDHYIFSIEDGYSRINQLQLGFRNLFYDLKTCDMFFRFNFYANAFFADLDIPQKIPKLYLDMEWINPYFEINFQNAWNFRNQVLDYSNFQIAWTINRYAAFKLNFLYRSRYDWRKANHKNFILDVSRQESELLSSPISDRRITLLTDLFFRFSPYWSCHIQSHHGWYRLNQPPYNEVKIDLFTLISSSWKVRFSYWHTETDDRFDIGIDLIKGK